MLGLRDRAHCQIPRFLPGELGLVEEDPHQLGNRERRVDVVHLDRRFLGKRRPSDFRPLGSGGRDRRARTSRGRPPEGIGSPGPRRASPRGIGRASRLPPRAPPPRAPPRANPKIPERGPPTAGACSPCARRTQRSADRAARRANSWGARGSNSTIRRPWRRSSRASPRPPRPAARLPKDRGAKAKYRSRAIANHRGAWRASRRIRSVGRVPWPGSPPRPWNRGGTRPRGRARPRRGGSERRVAFLLENRRGVDPNFLAEPGEVLRKAKIGDMAGERPPGQMLHREEVHPLRVLLFGSSLRSRSSAARSRLAPRGPAPRTHGAASRSRGRSRDHW